MHNTIYLNFDENGQLVQSLVSNTLPGNDWVKAPESYTVGDSVKLVNGKVTIIDNVEIQALQLEQLQQESIEQVRQFATNVRRQIADYADAYKLAGWNEKTRRAEAIVAGTASAEDIAIVKIEADKRNKGETPQQLAQLQLSKAQKLASAISLIDGMESSAIDRIKDAKSINEVENMLSTLYQEAEEALIALQ